MSDNNDHIPVEISFEYNGKEYWLSPATFKMLRQFEVKLQEDITDQAKKDVEGLPEKVAIAVMLEAVERKRQLKLGTVAFNQELVGVKYLPYVLQLLLSKKQPAITKDEALEMLDSPQALNIMNKAFRALGVSEPDPLAGKLAATK